MFPFESFEQCQDVSDSIPPFNFNYQVLQFQNQMLITNSINSAAENHLLPTDVLSNWEVNGTTENGSKFQLEINGNDSFFVEDGLGQFQFPEARNVIQTVTSNGVNGGDNMSVGFVPQPPPPPPPMPMSMPMPMPMQVPKPLPLDDVSIEASNEQEEVEKAMIAEVAAEKRRRRKIKNRESAARSRARKEAYAAQLKIEVDELETENSFLKKKKKILRGFATWVKKHHKYIRMRTQSVPP